VYFEVLMDGQLLRECGHRKSRGRVSPARVVEGVSAHNYYHHAAILAPTTNVHTRDPRHSSGKRNAWKVIAEVTKPSILGERRESLAWGQTWAREL
jgi:hypothetical protein